MRYILIASLLSCVAYAAPLARQGQQGDQRQGQQQQQGAQTGQNGRNGQKGQKGQANAQTGTANGQTPSSSDLATAVSNWQADTSMVSNFLNTGKSIQNNVQFKQAATVALNAEVDELTHKAIIDAANGNQPQVIAANSTLATAGAFQDVVDRLQKMSQQGRAAVANIDLINQNRCVNVLPNIDAYMASTGSSSQAIRPSVCDQTGVAGGVQGTGATQPGASPGSPAAAFAAAKALAAGTGNGLVQNGGNAGTGTAQQGQKQAGQRQQGQQQQQGTAQGQAGAGAGSGTQGRKGKGQTNQGQRAGGANAQAGAATTGQTGTAAKGQAGTKGQAGGGAAAKDAANQ